MPWQLLKFQLVVVICHLVVGRQTDIAFFRPGDECWLVTAVQQLDILCRRLSFADVVQQGQEDVVLLTINLFQLNGHVIGLCQCLRAEEIGRVVIGTEHSFVLRCHDRRELLQVTYHQQLYTAEWLVSVTESAQHTVDGIE